MTDERKITKSQPGSEPESDDDSPAGQLMKRQRVDASQIMSRTLAFTEQKVLARSKERGLNLPTLSDNVWSMILPFLAMSDFVKTGYFRVPKQYVLPETASYVIAIDNAFLSKFMGTDGNALISVQYWDRSKIGSNARVLKADTEKLLQVPLEPQDWTLWFSHFKKLQELRLFVDEDSMVLDALIKQNPDLRAVSLAYHSFTEEQAEDLVHIMAQSKVEWTEFSLTRKRAGNRLLINYLEHLPVTLTKLQITMQSFVDVPVELSALLQRYTRLVDLDLQTRAPQVRIQPGLFAEAKQKWQRLKYDNLLNDADLKAIAGDSLRVLICSRERDEGQRIHSEAVRNLIRNSPNLYDLQMSLYATKRDQYRDVFEELMGAKCASVMERFELGHSYAWNPKLNQVVAETIAFAPHGKFTAKYFATCCPRLDVSKLVYTP